MGLLREAKAKNYLKKLASACRVARGRKRNRKTRKCAGMPKTADWLAGAGVTPVTPPMPSEGGGLQEMQFYGEQGQAPLSPEEQLRRYYQEHPELISTPGNVTLPAPPANPVGSIRRVRRRQGTPKTASWLSKAVPPTK